MSSSPNDGDERNAAAGDPSLEIQEDGNEGQLNESSTRHSSMTPKLKLEEIDEHQSDRMATNENEQTIIGADESLEGDMGLHENQDHGDHETSDGDEVVSSSSDTPGGAGLKKMDKIAAAREKRKRLKRLPDKPEGHCFRVNGHIKWDLGKKTFLQKDYGGLVKTLADAWAVLIERYPGDRDWRQTGKELCEALNVDFRAIDDYADDVVNDPTTAVLELDEEETPSRRAQQLRTARFNANYRKLVYREHHTQTTKGKPGRQKRQREQTAEHEDAHQPKRTIDPKKETAKNIAERLGFAVALDDGDGHSTGVVQSETEPAKKKRKSNADRLGPVIIDWDILDKPYHAVAQLHAKSVPDRYKGGYGYWTREGRLWMLRKDIDRVIQAEKPDGSGKVLTDIMLAKYIPNYAGWVNQQKLGRDVVTREGTARQRAPKDLVDQRNESTGQYTKRDPDTTQKSAKKFYEDMHESVWNPEHLLNPPKVKNMKIRDTKARVTKETAQNVHIRKEMVDIQEHARQALKAEEQATKDKSTLVMHAAGMELELAETQKYLDNAYGLLGVWKERAHHMRCLLRGTVKKEHARTLHMKRQDASFEWLAQLADYKRDEGKDVKFVDESEMDRLIAEDGGDQDEMLESHMDLDTEPNKETDE
ncbi:hypothetical protein LTR10_020742 [Elasticomyces elasticus]|uniref:HMG box domain-containing protein n=1 Tax=Exophiala sideris TaxID=1016849 RepID=A0ABR0JM61_9EURO|nr:hypothetical protein LTR10_020742 [Elasticomyces elasticus]KAK5036669.1 hypothetical protein LTS07_002397 [Exophiala sideris]KAK5067053.1 hypothetical protein LTR69_002402 [Exophiala sideris]KAK5185111.1 hypothetical protein LTR44_002958 [Eurotiomycetes sp. CCFEE 6388]